MACGTKSIGKQMIRKDGLSVIDCHAEVLARRGFKYYLMKNKDQLIGETKVLKDGIKFHLYVSEVPCGDASMGFEHASSHNKREQKASMKEGGHWSGAKTVSGCTSAETGIARIKCGRSDLADEQRSVSMSCSDKILMWNIIGIQGGLLGSNLSKPIFLSSIIIETDV